MKIYYSMGYSSNLLQTGAFSRQPRPLASWQMFSIVITDSLFVCDKKDTKKTRCEAIVRRVTASGARVRVYTVAIVVNSAMREILLRCETTAVFRVTRRAYSIDRRQALVGSSGRIV